MCSSLGGEGSPQRALCALRYHTKLVLLLLEKLDLPLAQLQELRIGCRRRCPPAAAADGGATSGRRWRVSALGGIHLALEPRCSVWRRLWEAARPTAEDEEISAIMEDGEGDDDAVASEGVGWFYSRDASPVGYAATLSSSSGPGPTFFCLSSEEAALIEEVEVHVCAAMRHLARTSQRVPRAYFSPGASRGRLGFEPVSPVGCGDGPVDDPASLPCGTKSPGWRKSPLTSPKGHEARARDLGGASESNGDGPQTNGHRVGDTVLNGTAGAAVSLGVALAAALERVIEVTWAFFLYAQLVDSLFRGDVVASAAWSLRFLGVAEPWSLRRLQELVVQALEVAVEHPGGLWQGHDQEPEPLASSLRFLRESCAAYLGAPFIPRFEARVRRSIEGLRDRGLLQSPAPRGGSQQAAAAAAAEARALNEAVAAALGEGGGGSSSSAPSRSPEGARQHDFGGSWRASEAFRSRDRLHAAFRRALLEALAGHPDGGCACFLDVREHVLFGAGAATLLDPGGPWPKERREAFQALFAVVGTVPQPLTLQRPLALADLELGNDSSEHVESPEAIGLEDVFLEVGVTDREVAYRVGLVTNGERCGLCCAAGGRTNGANRSGGGGQRLAPLSSSRPVRGG